jgi:hypothetical protein
MKAMKNVLVRQIPEAPIFSIMVFSEGLTAGRIVTELSMLTAVEMMSSEETAFRDQCIIVGKQEAAKNIND